MKKKYHPDGTASGHFTEGEWTDNGIYIEEYGFKFLSKWKIQNGVVVISGIVTVPPGFFKSGTVIRDKIVFIRDKEAKYVDVDGGRTFMRYRK